MKNYRYIPKITEIDWEHIFNGTRNKAMNKINGYHSTYLHPEFMHRIYTRPGLDVAFKAAVKNIKIYPTSIFPDNWDGKKIIEKIIEAYKNPIHESEAFCTIIGQTKEGIEIRLIFDKQGKLKTAFPQF